MSDGLSFSDALGVLTAVVVGAALIVWLVRRTVRTLGRLMPDRFFANHDQERNTLVLLTMVLSIAQAARGVSSPTAVYGSTVELVLLGLSLVTVSAIVILPFVLLLSPAYRMELRQRFDVVLAGPFGIEQWTSARGAVAIASAVALVPFYLLGVGLPAALAYLRGRAGNYAERRASRRSRIPTTSRQPAAQQPAAQQPAAREPGQPRRRWWQAPASGDPDREPKFRTRAGGDGQTRMTARRTTVKDDDGKPFDAVEIGINASFRVPRAGSPVVQVLELLDVTDVVRGPVAVHRWGGDVLRTGGPYRIENQTTVPHASAVLNKSVTVALPALHAPYRGDRTLRARFTMHRPRTPGQPVAQGWVEFPYREKVTGYVEAPRLRRQVEAGIATAGFAAVVADGDVGAAEVRLLEQFLADRHRRAGDDGELAGAARAALDDARMRARSGVSARELLGRAGRDLADAEDGPRESAYELAVRIMAVDGRITEDELARLNEVAEVLNLSAETTATLRNRHMKVEMFEGDESDPLGVPPGTPEEQRRFLREQLRTWRPVLTNPDAEKRKQAQTMIDRITERIAEIDRATASSM